MRSVRAAESSALVSLWGHCISATASSRVATAPSSTRSSASATARVRARRAGSAFERATGLTSRSRRAKSFGSFRVFRYTDRVNRYLRSNQEMWDVWARHHVASPFYDVEGFKAGRREGRRGLDALERRLVGDVAGKTLLHLQCHFGLDTLAWARLGAKVTGIDFSDEAIALAQSLSQELKLDATFLCTELYSLPAVLDAAGEFDIVYTSYGAIGWLPDL